jgi:hypothetical protein
MNLYLKHGKKTSTGTSIYLKDFHIPAVGTVEIDHTVEPAIWFKSLIIDSMKYVSFRSECVTAECVSVWNFLAMRKFTLELSFHK